MENICMIKHYRYYKPNLWNSWLTRHPIGYCLLDQDEPYDVSGAPRESWPESASRLGTHTLFYLSRHQRCTRSGTWQVSRCGSTAEHRAAAASVGSQLLRQPPRRALVFIKKTFNESFEPTADILAALSNWPCHCQRPQWEWMKRIPGLQIISGVLEQQVTSLIMCALTPPRSSLLFLTSFVANMSEIT